jgi:hypothetical protein
MGGDDPNIDSNVETSSGDAVASSGDAGCLIFVGGPAMVSFLASLVLFVVFAFANKWWETPTVDNCWKIIGAVAVVAFVSTLVFLLRTFRER